MRFRATLFTGLCLSALMAGPGLATTQPAAAQADNTANTNSEPPASSTATDSTATDGPRFKEGEPLEPIVETPAPSSEPAATNAEQQPPETEAPTSTTATPGVEEPKSDEQPAAASAEPVIDPLQTEMLRQIAEAKGISKADRTALTAFYEGRGGDLLWVSGANFTARGNAAIAEIRQADDWGLDASTFDLPSVPTSSEPADVAATELSFSLAALKYADHARGGRMDPKQLSNYIDRDPPTLPVADVLAGLAASDAADAYLRKLHPQHPQFD